MNKTIKENMDKTASIMKEISKQCSIIKDKMSDENRTAMHNVSDRKRLHEEVRHELTAIALKEAFHMAAKEMRLTRGNIAVGDNFINMIMNKDRALPSGKKIVNTNLVTYREQGSLSSLYADLITSYTKMALAEKAEINEMTLFDESFILEGKGLGKDFTDAFKSKIKEYTPKDVGETVSNRVEKATKEFIKERNDKIDKIKDIYNKVKNFANNPNASKKDIEKAQEAAKIKISKIKEQKMGLMESMINTLATACMTDKDLHNKYMTESNELDMDGIIDDTAAVYAVMEIANITNLVKIDERFIDSYINA